MPNTHPISSGTGPFVIPIPLYEVSVWMRFHKAIGCGSGAIGVFAGPNAPRFPKEEDCMHVTKSKIVMSILAVSLIGIAGVWATAVGQSAPEPAQSASRLVSIYDFPQMDGWRLGGPGRLHFESGCIIERGKLARRPGATRGDFSLDGYSGAAGVSDGGATLASTGNGAGAGGRRRIRCRQAGNLDPSTHARGHLSHLYCCRRQFQDQ